MGKQKYFLAAVTNDGRYITIEQMDSIKLTGQKTIDKYTSQYTKDDLIRIFEKEYSIKAKDFKLEYRKTDNDTFYFGIVSNNKEFRECLDNLKSNKNGDFIPKNSEIYKKEYELLEITALSDLDYIKKVYGEASPMYSRACNFSEKGNNYTEERDLLREEFSKYINFRKWLVREERVTYSNGHYEQLNITDYDIFDRIPNLNERINSTKETLEEKKARLLDFNREYERYEIDKEDTLELTDFEKTTEESVGTWEPRKWVKRR